MKNPSQFLDQLTKELSKLPGIGPKSASRLAFHVLSMRIDDVERLAKSLVDLKTHMAYCEICGGVSDKKICSICEDETRDVSLLCVVAEARDVLAIESTNGFNGKYHVLRGLISPLDGVGANDLNIASLVKRCSDGLVRELVLAINPTVEGDATALYIAKLFKDIDVKVTKIAHGLPVGADLEYSDNATLIKSIEGRVEV